ncbi:MAG: type transport system ATP-binding protein [Mycobacterium sp.]|nr:type transport system ATP-binding protein [Mycobacterium sp.]
MYIAMGASVYVGRVGGLAVALGIGAAVFLGHGVASADTSGTSGSAGSGDSSSASGQSSTKSATTGTSASDKQASGEKTSTATDSSEPKTTETGDTKSADSSERKTTGPKSKKKKPDASAQSTRTAGDSTPKVGAGDKTEQSDASASMKTASTKTVTESTATESTVTESTATDEDAQTAGASPTSVEVSQSTTTDVAVATPAPSHPAPADTVAAAVVQVVSAVLSPFAGTSPTAPAESPMPWIAMAAARKEIGTTANVARVADPVTTSAAVDPTPTAAPAIAYPTNVVAIPQISLVTALGLQNLPIVGPLFVTPIVAFVNAIPIVGDLLHPIFGYPLQAGLPVGSPQARDVRVISFDGTQISVHFMPATGLLAGRPAPTILDGPGLGEPGATNLNGTPFDGIIQDNLGLVGIATLRDAGYNVVTWDPRGEYFSGGVLELDSPDYEARDVSSIISWVAQQPEAQLDGLNDPRLGMVGVSYGGGIQLVSAAIDHRIDAIVPTIAWNTLNDALYPNQDFKSGWGTLLTAALLATFARPNPEVYPAAIYGDLTTTLTQAQQDLLAARGPGGTLGLLSKITAPTLFIQGTVDTLFPLAEANLNATQLPAGVPTKVVWFCGGHGLCVNDLLDARDGVVIQQSTLAWLDRYVKGDTTAVTGPQFQWVDQRGQYYSSNVYPVPTGTPIVTSSNTSQFLPLVPFLAGSGPLLGVLPIGGTRAFNAINLTVPAATATTYVVGAPQLTFTYSGSGTSRFVYAQLVDDSTGLVLGNQVTPIPVTLNGQTQTATAPLNMVAATLTPGQTVTLQIVASSTDFAALTSLGQFTVSSMTLSLPTADPSSVTTTTNL